MSEPIERGDRATSDVYPGTEFEVEAVRGEYAWAFVADSDTTDPWAPSPGGRIFHVDRLTKVQPKWEVGKTYRVAGDSPSSRENTYRVTAVDPDGNALAVGKYADGSESLVPRQADWRSKHVEVTGDE